MRLIKVAIAKFGAFARSNLLDPVNEEPEQDSESLWSEEPVKITQEKIPASELIEGDGSENLESKIRYWSDFDRFYHVAETMQSVPDPVDWEDTEGNWTMGHDIFQRYDEETDLMEDSIRRLLEDCDSPQGLQVLCDSSTFGSFTQSFLNSFHDDSPKLSSILFPVLSDASLDKDGDDKKNICKLISDALLIRELQDLASLTSPMMHPKNYSIASSGLSLQYEQNSIYQSSALISSQIENVTLPLRLRKGGTDVIDFVSHLTSGSGISTSLCQVSGTFPGALEEEEALLPVFDFSSGKLFSRKYAQYARRDVLRGFDSAGLKTRFGTWSLSNLLSGPHITSFLPAYPCTPSFPSIFQAALGQAHTPLLSSLSTSTSIVPLLKLYASTCERPLDQTSIDFLDKDELKELASDLLVMADSLGGEGEIEEERGEDDD